MRNKALFIPAAAIVTVCCIAALLLVSTQAMGDNGNFDAQTWREHSSLREADSPRADMVEELIQHHLPEGMARNEVLQLLGPPNGKDSDKLLYALGAASFSPDVTYLVIVFNADNRLERAYVESG